MEIGLNKEGIPPRMKALVAFVSFLYLPVLVPEQRILPKDEILVSLCGYIFGPFLALIPLSYRLRCVLGSLIGVLPILVFFSNYFRAFLLGLCFSYYRTVAELFCQALSVTAKKRSVSVLFNLINAWICFTTFFLIHFCPRVPEFAALWYVLVIGCLISAGLAAVYIIETPEEMLERFKKEKRKTEVYDEMYKVLLYINGPFAKDNEDLHEDFKDLLDRRNDSLYAPTLKERSTAILISVNISFVYAAVQRVLGVDNHYSLYRIFLGAMQMFSLAMTYSSGTLSFFSAAVPAVALYFVCVSTSNYNDAILVFVMALGTSFIPSEKSAYTMSPMDIVLTRSLQGLLTALLFGVITPFIYY
ncbi:hypothetical protein NEDG_00183 [Nematocida displodere]|uniref:Uncharacterized protein n=1 Tax=Nematocida displodere TaxID=1805483 RepID=A0A177EIK1_9MICR|nr:hypothetical protein NEDG_00183 [Nematocida displodere]